MCLPTEGLSLWELGFDFLRLYLQSRSNRAVGPVQIIRSVVETVWGTFRRRVSRITCSPTAVSRERKKTEIVVFLL